MLASVDMFSIVSFKATFSAVSVSTCSVSAAICSFCESITPWRFCMVAASALRRLSEIDVSSLMRRSLSWSLGSISRTRPVK